MKYEELLHIIITLTLAFLLITWACRINLHYHLKPLKKGLLKQNTILLENQE
jgi:hypothetical protein